MRMTLTVGKPLSKASKPTEISVNFTVKSDTENPIKPMFYKG